MVKGPLSFSLFNQSQEQIPWEKSKEKKKKNIESKHNDDMTINVQII